MNTFQKPKAKSGKSRERGGSKFTPKTEFGRKLWALRQQYIAEGGKLFSVEEIQAEVAKRRGEIA